MIARRWPFVGLLLVSLSRRAEPLSPPPPLAAQRVQHANPAHEDPPGGLWLLPPGSLRFAEDGAGAGVGATAEALPGFPPGALLLRGVCAPEACRRLVQAAEAVGFEQPGNDDSGGEGERRNGALSWVLGDEDARVLAERIWPLLPQAIATTRGRRRASVRPSKPRGAQDGGKAAGEAVGGEGVGAWARRADGAPEGTYRLAGINQRCRIYRYRAGSADEVGPVGQARKSF